MASTTPVAFDKGARRLTFAYSAPKPHTKWVFDLWDETLGQHWGDNCSLEGATKGTGTGWSSACYLGGATPTSSGVGTFTNVDPSTIQPDHQYSIRIAFPDEGGGTGGEAHISGAELLSLPDLSGGVATPPSTTTAGPSAPAAAPVGDFFSGTTMGIPNWALLAAAAVLVLRAVD